ncbi:MAG: hypothetical protein H6707_03510 [Deltaproteobacteria bacterium]|nr:hypothetical protein [Deltaproteobacteria bacterium]
MIESANAIRPVIPDRESGQAMAEYALVLGAFMGVLSGVGFTFLPDFLDAMQLYLDQHYFWLSMPF